jgi:hypothetical protein
VISRLVVLIPGPGQDSPGKNEFDPTLIFFWQNISEYPGQSRAGLNFIHGRFFPMVCLATLITVRASCGGLRKLHGMWYWPF